MMLNKEVKVRSDEDKLAIDNKSKVERLLQNKDFVDIILERYMRDTIHDLMYREGSSKGTLRGIDSRKDLNDFIYGVIEEGKISEEK